MDELEMEARWVTPSDVDRLLTVDDVDWCLSYELQGFARRREGGRASRAGT